MVSASGRSTSHGPQRRMGGGIHLPRIRGARRRRARHMPRDARQSCREPGRAGKKTAAAGRLEPEVGIARVKRMHSTDYQPFPPTHWSLVRRAGAPLRSANGPEKPLDSAAGAEGESEKDLDAARREALAVLLARYQPALRSYLRVVRRFSAHETDDLLQGFITDQVLAHELLRRADETRGRFRSLLLTCLNNFVASRFRAKYRRSEEPLDHDAAVSTGVDGASPAAVVEAAWARALVNEVLKAMRDECTQTRRQDVWAVFEGRVLAEVFEQREPVSYEALRRSLNLKSPMQAANLLVTAKRMYARLLRSAVAEYERNAHDIDAEIASLRHILSQSGTLRPVE